MKRGEKQSPEMKAKVLVGMRRHFALKKCVHEFEAFPNLGGASHFARCKHCGKYLRKTVIRKDSHKYDKKKKVA